MDKQWRFFRADLLESSLGWSWKKLQRIWTSAKNWHFYGDLQRRRYRWGKWGINSTNFQLWDNSDLCRLRRTLVWQAKNPFTRWSYTAWGDRCCHSYKLSERSLVLRQTLDWHKCPALATRSLLCFLILNYILLIGVEVWKSINLLSRPKFYTSQRCGSVEKSDKGRILSHFFEVWKSPTKSGYWCFFLPVTNAFFLLLTSTLLRGVQVCSSLTNRV